MVKKISERLAKFSGYLQSLNSPQFASQVEEAAEKKDKKALIKICRDAKIPNMYVGSVVGVILSVVPDEKWPDVA